MNQIKDETDFLSEMYQEGFLLSEQEYQFQQQIDHLVAEMKFQHELGHSIFQYLKAHGAVIPHVPN
jgi:hypothetical protein